LIIPLVFLLSCGEEHIQWELDTSPSPVLVVEGIITNEPKVHQVKISRPMEDPNAEPEMVSGALVSVFEGTNSVRLRESEPGIYETGPNARAVVGKTYTLFIYYQGNEYFATTWMVPVSPLYPLRYRRVEDAPQYYELQLRETDDPSMIEINLDWSHLPAYAGAPPEETHARIVYYTVKSIDVNKIFRPSRERVLFPAGTMVYRKKYSLSAPQEDFVRTLMAETEWRGGSFDVQPGNVHTNLSEGAIGYFSASSVVADTSLILPLN
jgi:hypothetical protein